MVSIVMPAFNSAEFLEEAVASVRRQTYAEWELYICIDPKSTDATSLLAQNLAAGESRIRLVYPEWPGVAAARNAGLELARGKYLAFLDSDDVWQPCKLSQQVRSMEETGSVFSCTRFRRLAGRPGRRREGHLIALPGSITYHRLLQQNCILLSSVMLEREALWAERFREVGCEDFDLWLRILRTGVKCLGIQQDLLRYRISRGSRGSDKFKSLRETWQIYRRSENLNAVWSSTILMPFLARNLLKYSRF